MDDDKTTVEETTPSPSDETKTDSGDYTADLSTEEDPEYAPQRKKSAEARIHQLVAKNKELEERMAGVEKAKDQNFDRQPTPPVQPQVKPEEQLTPEVAKAVEFLKSQGFTTKEDLESFERKTSDRQALNSEHVKLITKYDGSDGRPSYNQDTVENYMRNNGIYKPEVAYKMLYETELLDFELKRVEGKLKTKPYVERAGTDGAETAQKRSISKEKIENAALTPQGKAWYERNREKILDLMAKGQY